MFCRICGEQIPDNAKFCPKCGEGAASLSKNGKQVKMPKMVKTVETGRQTGQQTGQQTWQQRRRQKRRKWEMAHPIYRVPYNIGNFGMLAGIVMSIAGWFISNDLAGILGKLWNQLSKVFGDSTSMFGILKTVLTGESSKIILGISKDIDRTFDTSFTDTISLAAFVGMTWIIVLIAMIYYALTKNIRGLTKIYVIEGVMIVFFMCMTIGIYSLFGKLTDVSEGTGFNVFLIGSIVILISFFIEVMLDCNVISKQKNRVILNR